MGAEFESSAQESDITNAQLVPNSLGDAQVPKADIAFTADVTYFVREIVDFIRQMEAAASRRVMVTIWSEPPPNRRARIFQLVYGEKQAVLPGQAQLLPVLWDMGILPDVQVLPESPWWENERPPTREEAVKLVLEDRVIKPEDRERAGPLIESHFDELFAPSEAGFVPQWRTDMKELLITWETGN